MSGRGPSASLGVATDAYMVCVTGMHQVSQDGVVSVANVAQGCSFTVIAEDSLERKDAREVYFDAFYP